MRSILKFNRPSANSFFNCHNPKGIKFITRLRLGLSHLRVMVLRSQSLNGFNHISQTKFFCGTWGYLLSSWNNNLWFFTRTYLRPASLPNIYKWFTTAIKWNWVILQFRRYLYLLSRLAGLGIMCKDRSGPHYHSWKPRKRRLWWVMKHPTLH